MKNEDFWLKLSRELQSMSQSGLAFSKDEYDIRRYERLREISSEILENYSEIDKKKSQNVFMNQLGYATPKIDVRSAVVHEGKLLLVKEIQDGCWAMPGGWADVGDYPSEVAVRETKEESGYDIKVKKLLAVFDANRADRDIEFFHAFKLIFLCELTGGEPDPDHEISDVGFFEFDKLPELSKFRTNEKHIAEIMEHLKDINRETAFD